MFSRLIIRLLSTRAANTARSAALNRRDGDPGESQWPRWVCAALRASWLKAQPCGIQRGVMATQQAEEDLSGIAEGQDVVTLRLLRNMSPHTLSSLLAVERDAFPECERLGNYMQELSMARNNGLVIAENQPPPGTPPGAFPAPLAEPQGFCLFSRTAEAGIIMKIAVAAAFRGRGVGTALLR